MSNYRGYLTMNAMRWTLLASLVLLLGGGCSGTKLPPNARPTAPVKVTVTYKGAPVADATVTFICQEGDATPAFGKTDAQGVAKMKTYVEGDGAVIGPHKVLVTKTEASSSGKVADQSSPDYVPPAEGGAPLPTAKNLVPPKYGMIAQSGLTATVEKKPANEFSFELKE
jgi:hypothetical protein